MLSLSLVFEIARYLECTSLVSTFQLRSQHCLNCSDSVTLDNIALQNKFVCIFIGLKLHLPLYSPYKAMEYQVKAVNAITIEWIRNTNRLKLRGKQ